MSSAAISDSDIAIVGMAGRFPGAPDLETFWTNLRDGIESIRRFSPSELAELGVPEQLTRRGDFVPAGAGIEQIDGFDHGFWGYSPREAALLDPQQRLFLETAWEAMEHAGHDPSRPDGLVGIYAGAGLSTYLIFNLHGNPEITEADTQLAMLGNDKDFLSTRTAYHLDLRGPAVTVQAGCSTSLVAVHLACDSLLSFQCDLALAGGVGVVLPERTGYLHFPGSTASSDGYCRAFDERGDGTVFGTGVGVVVLRRLADALAHGDTIHAVVKGSAVNNDGAQRVGFTAPGAAGQAEVIVRAQRVADVPARTVSYVEAHGTGTPLGDPVEVAALTAAFRESTDDVRFCALGSVKTNIGHLDAAAGVASLIKTALALRHGVIPPVLHFTRPNPRIDLATSPFHVNAVAMPWPSGHLPRRAGVSSFGFGGTNAHLVLEESPQPSPAPSDVPSPQLLVLSARTAAALDVMVSRLADQLDAAPDLSLADVAYTLQRGRSRFAHRRALVCGDREEAVRQLRGLEPEGMRRRHEVHQNRAASFLFPGLGDQYVGMGADLYRNQPVFRATVDHCAESLRDEFDLDLRELLYPASPDSPDAPAGVGTLDLRAMLVGASPSSVLHRTELAHPALFVVEYALAQQLRAWGIRPAALLGHSLGEYVAATVAGVFRLPDALRLVAHRARLIERLPEGAMLAVPLAPDRLAGMLGDRRWVALHNGPELTVVAGAPAEIEELREQLAGHQVAVRPVVAGHAFHTPMLDPVVEELTDLVATMPLAAPSVPIVSNVTGDWMSADAATDARYWGRHSALPVRFAEGLQTLCADRDHALLELGPGQSLSALAAEHLGESRGADTVVLPTLRAGYDRRRSDTDQLLEVLGQLWLAGVAVDWPGVHAPQTPRRIPLPTYPFERRRAWIDRPAPGAATMARSALPGPGSGRRPNPDDWFLVPSLRSVPLPPPAAAQSWMPGANWLLLADATGVADRLAARLVHHGQRVTVVRPGRGYARLDEATYLVDPAVAADHVALCAGLATSGRLPSRVVALWSLCADPPDLAPGHDLDELHLGYFGLVGLAAALAAQTGPWSVPDADPLRLWVVCNGVVSVRCEDVLRPATAALLGAARCIPQEIEGISAHCVDVEPDVDVDVLLNLVAENPEEKLLAYRRNRLWVPTFEPVTARREGTPLRPGGVYLLVGGLGEVGLDLAEHLAGRQQCRLVLTGRSEFPAEADWSSWLERHPEQDPTSRQIRRLVGLRELGSAVLVLSADVTDLAEMQAAIEQIRCRFGPVNGVVHAAGVVGPAAFLPVEDSTPERAWPIMAAKVRGCAVLADALAGEEPDFVLLLSSNAALLGGIGTSAYSASSVFLDTFAQRQYEHHGTRWISINLEDWLPEGGSALPQLSITQYGITAAEGVAALSRVMTAAPAGQVTLVTGDLEQRLDLWIRHPEAARRGPKKASRQARPALSSAYQPPSDDVERTITEIWQDFLGFDQIGRCDNFYDLGGHSLLATQIVSRARAAFRVELSLLDLLVAPTVAGFAAAVRSGCGVTAPPDPIPVAPRDRPLPLSYSQQRFWFLDHLAPGNPYYNISDVVRIDGPLDIEVLRCAVNDVVARHDALRTAFPTVDGEPVQMVAPKVDVGMPVVDLSDLPDGQRSARWREIALAEAAAPFDLATTPLLRAQVLRLEEHTHILLLTTHHSVSDAWSTGVFVRELGARYAAHSGLPAPDLAPLPIQYADFAAWQRESLSGPRRDVLVEYWRNQLYGAPPLVEFPTDFPRPAEQSFRGATHPITLPAELVGRLRELGTTEDCTLFMALLAAYCCLLERYSGESDVVVGSPIAGRTHPMVEDLIGVFVNMLPLRVRLEPGRSFRKLLADVQAVTLGAYEHQDLPFELLVEELAPDRSLSHGQVFQNVFVLQNAPLPPLELADLQLTPVRMPAVTAKFDVMVMLRETDSGAIGDIEYSTDLFTAETIARIADSYLAILEQVVADPDRAVADLELLTVPQRELVLGAWAHGPSLPAGAESIPELFGAMVVQASDRSAVYRADRPGWSLTFGELESRANQVAHYLRACGLGAGSRVGVALHRDPDAVVVLLGILKAGAAYVPLDPTYPAERLEFMVADAAPEVLVVTDQVSALRTTHSSVRTLDELWSACRSMPTAPVDHRVRAEDAAYVLYTSGSTGAPKAAVGLHRGMVNRLRWMWREFGFADGEVGCQKTSLSFLDSFWEIFGPLCHSVPIVVVPHEQVVDPALLVDALARYAVTRIVLVPSLLRALLDTEPDLADRLPALRLWVTSGEALPAGLAGRFLAALPDAILLNLYGASEVSADVTYHVVTAADVEQGVIPIGRPIAETTVYLLDEQMRLTPPGAEGELYVGGAPVGAGYLGRPELTSERFVPDPFDHDREVRFYRTGDRARFRADGSLCYLGRRDQQLKVRGFRVEPSEVERALVAHPRVADAAVVAEDEVLVAYWVAADGAEPAAGELREHLVRSLPHYLVPSAFVACARFPLTPSGKVDRTALSSVVRRPEQGREPRVPPRSAAEQVVAGLWSELLNETGEIGVHDNFFTVGGHSLLATKFVVRVRDAFDADLSLRTFLADPTVAGVVSALREGLTSAAGGTIEATDDGSGAPLSFAQQQLWTFERMFPDTGAYNVATAMRLTGPLRQDALEQAVNATLARHSVLRARFSCDSVPPTQWIAPHEPKPLPVCDLTTLDPSVRGQRADEWVRRATAEPFDLANGPLLRALLLRLDGGEHLFVLTMHHIVGDAWSGAVLLRELTSRYRAIVGGRPEPLAALPIQYADFARWQRRQVADGCLDLQLAHWRARLADPPPALELPTDRPRPAQRGFRGEVLRMDLPADIVVGLRGLCRAEQVTPFMVHLAGFLALLHRYTGQADIVVGTPVANRGLPELEPLVGYLVNTLLLRVRVDRQRSFAELLRQVRAETSDALANQDVPFEKVFEELRPVWGADVEPLFGVLFSYRSAAPPTMVEGVLATEVPVHNGTSKRDLTLHLVEGGDRLSGHLEYDRDLFEPATVSRLAGHYQRLLAAALADPGRPIGELSVLTEPERRMLVGIAGRSLDPPDRCLHELVAAQAARTPRAPAVRCLRERLSYDELNRRANQLAHRLRCARVGPEVTVGICMARRSYLVVAVLGVLKAGGAFVPVDPLDPPARREAVLRDAGARIVVADAGDTAGLSRDYEVVELDSTWRSLDGCADDDPAVGVRPSNMAYLLYTSGSTGTPKGVVVEHRQLVNYTAAVIDRYRIDGAWTYAMLQPLTVDSSFTVLASALCTGGELHLLSQEQALDAALLADHCARHPVDCLKIAPSHLRALARSPRFGELLPRRLLVVGGEASDWHWLREVDDLPGDRAVFNHYGPTETTVGVLTLDVGGYRHPDRATAPLGEPLANTQAYVLDPNGQLQPVGVAGELYIGGANLARGYHGRPDLTAVAFVPNPFGLPGSRLYRTGDFARYRPDGVIEFLGRRDDQIKIRGRRVEVDEVGGALAAHPAVRESVVVAREEASGARCLVGYLVASEPGPSVTETVLGSLRAQLPPHMVPSALLQLPALPRTPHGKLDRAALPAPNTNPAGPSLDGELERTLAAAWTRLLGRNKVGSEENFFDLGGDSLLVVHLHQELQRLLDREFALIELFRFTTVRAQARFLASADHSHPELGRGRERGRRQAASQRRWHQTRRAERSRRDR